MKNRNSFIKKNPLFFYGFIAILGIGLVTGIVTGCGKLNDDTGQPSTPSGTTGYSPISYGPKSTVGTFTLSMEADPTTVPADGTNYSTITVKLSNTSGIPVSGYTVKYTADKLYGWFYEPDSGQFVSEAEGLTDQNGVSVKRFYGTRSGQGVARAEVDVDEDGTADLVVSKPVTFTSGGQPSSAWPYTLELSASPSSIYANLLDYSTIIATLKDATGGSVENFTIEFEAELGYLSNDNVPPTAQTGNSKATALTNKNGSVSLYYYGARKGSAVISASVFVQDLMTSLQAKTVIKVLEGPGKPGEDVAGIAVDVKPDIQYVKADKDTGLSSEQIKITISGFVWDETGDPSLAGVRVEFSGACNGFATTKDGGAFPHEGTIECNLGVLEVGTHEASVTACVNTQKARYCDTDMAYIVVTATPPAEPTVTPTVTPTITLTVNKSGTGTITSNPTGINCGSDCTETFSQATSVTLTATPESGSSFGGWSGGGCSGTIPICTLQVSAATTVSAVFTTP
ncbi:hypothetical protein U14_04086 [Candidatus Moduliflexus flocculans]|uniref:Big-1 domain-containing protein n=1 Tax=Candidatus Moduliflexus flocculans TaxID=1499966 RepID=A0A0S6VZW1_9BACT|nr:hypothetical protein U14_04086 [Candidatus Moduliflexus flocculans]